MTTTLIILFAAQRVRLCLSPSGAGCGPSPGVSARKPSLSVFQDDRNASMPDSSRGPSGPLRTLSERSQRGVDDQSISANRDALP